MRAHVIGSRIKDARLFSLILFGPPGTGKTSLIKALAASCKVPLITVTPSDMTVSGREGIERRAREVFEALSMLTSCVILFDEFEDVIRMRSAVSVKGGDLVSEFLTPGMLPKLSTLYDRSKSQGIAYCLATNHFERLDPAAIREGRFDARAPVYSPDLLSRAGAAVWQVVTGAWRNKKGKWLEVVEEVVRESRGVSAGEFSKQFLGPLKDGESAFKELAAGSSAGDTSEPAAEASDGARTLFFENEVKLREWLDRWEEKAFKLGLETALKHPPGDLASKR